MANLVYNTTVGYIEMWDVIPYMTILYHKRYKVSSVFSRTVGTELPSLRAKRSNLSLKTESPQICFRASLRKEELNGSKETR